MGVRSFWGGFLGPKMPFLRPENGENKVFPFLGFFRSFVFVTARFCGGFWATSSVICIGRGFVWFRVCVFVWVYLSELGSSCFFFAVLGTLGPLFRVPFPSSLLFLLLLPHFLLSGSAWVLFLFFLACLARTPPAQGRPGFASCIALFLFFSPLPARAGPSLPRPFFLLSLSLFLSLLHALNIDEPCNCPERLDNLRRVHCDGARLL